MRVGTVFFFLGIIALLGAGYFGFQLVLGPANPGEILVLPIYIGFSLIIAKVCFVIAFVMYLLQRRK